MNIESVKQAVNTLREHMSALEQMERPEALRELVDRVRDVETRMNDILPRVQKLNDVAERMRQIHDDMLHLQTALAA